MKRKTKKWVMATAGLVISALALVFFLYRLGGHWRDVLAAFREARYRYLIPSIALLSILYALRIARWKLFLAPIKRVGWFSTTSATLIGFTANNVLPARLGELIRPYLLHRREKVGFGHALATVGLARVFDLIGLALLLLLTWVILAIGTPFSARANSVEALGPGIHQTGTTQSSTESPGTPTGARADLVHKVWKGGLVVAGMAAAGTCVLLGLALFPAPFLKVGEFCTRILPEAWRAPLIGLMQSVAEAMGFLKNWRGVAMAVVLSLGVWLAQGLSTWALSRGLGLEIGAAGAFLTVIAISAAVAVPQGPGFLGTFHLAAALVAEGFQTPTGQAGAFAMLLWLVNIVPVTLLGFAFLAYEGINLKRLSKESREMEEREEEDVEQTIENTMNA